MNMSLSITELLIMVLLLHIRTSPLLSATVHIKGLKYEIKSSCQRGYS